MKIILLSGGSGKRLWPLSNDIRSKQFLKVLESPTGERESMIQRVVRQIKATGKVDGIIVATGETQIGYVRDQLKHDTNIVTEPCRRDTFPAIALSCSYLAVNGTDPNEPVIVMPCDSYTDDSYFETICSMAEAIDRNDAELILMGVTPTYPSEKYGYIVPCNGVRSSNGVLPVRRFTEKPDLSTAKKLLEEGALWNGGVFAFRLRYLMKIVDEYMPNKDFNQISKDYEQFPKISFDYEVVEKAKSIGVIPFSGEWCDLGTWNTLTEKLNSDIQGKAKLYDCQNTHVVNELGIPVLGLGLKDIVIAVSEDGILISDKTESEKLKSLL